MYNCYNVLRLRIGLWCSMFMVAIQNFQFPSHCTVIIVVPCLVRPRKHGVAAVDRCSFAQIDRVDVPLNTKQTS